MAGSQSPGPYPEAVPALNRPRMAGDLSPLPAVRVYMAGTTGTYTQEALKQNVQSNPPPSSGHNYFDNRFDFSNYGRMPGGPSGGPPGGNDPPPPGPPGGFGSGDNPQPPHPPTTTYPTPSFKSLSEARKNAPKLEKLASSLLLEYFLDQFEDLRRDYNLTDPQMVGVFGHSMSNCKVSIVKEWWARRHKKHPSDGWLDAKDAFYREFVKKSDGAKATELSLNFQRTSSETVRVPPTRRDPRCRLG